MIIVGNKCDLINDRVVASSEGEEMAHQFNCAFIESSAKTNVNVNEVFREIIFSKIKYKY